MDRASQNPLLEAAVIGVGSMGRNHARVYNQMRSVELAAVVDLDETRTSEAARLYGVRAFSDHCTMLREIQPSVVSVAVPTRAHCQATLDALDAGCHVLVEKPIAATLEEAQRMIGQANKLNRVLAVGHIERYNPAICELKRRLDRAELGRIFQIHARRLGSFPTQVSDVGVVLDLATHDLDIMRYVTGQEIRRLYAETEREIHSAHEDLFSGLVRFSDGVVGALDINWLTPTKIREITVTGQRGMFLANLLTQDLYFYENVEANGLDWDHLSLLRGVAEGKMVRLRVDRREPLRLELEAFVDAARGEEAATVDGDDALVVLELARELVRSGQEGCVINVLQQDNGRDRDQRAAQDKRPQGTRLRQKPLSVSAQHLQ